MGAYGMPASNIAEGWGKAQLRANTNGQVMGIRQMQAQANLGGYSANAQARGYGAHGGRMGQAAEFDAAEDAWYAQNKYGQQLAGTSAALGLFAGSMAAGEKPGRGYRDGMAMQGMLDSGRHGSAKRLGQFFNPNSKGGYFSTVGQTGSRLNSQVGSQAVGSRYNPTNPTNQVVEAFKATGDGMFNTISGGDAGGGNRSGNQQRADTNNYRNNVGGPGDRGSGAHLNNMSNRARGGVASPVPGSNDFRRKKD